MACQLPVTRCDATRTLARINSLGEAAVRGPNSEAVLRLLCLYEVHTATTKDASVVFDAKRSQCFGPACQCLALTPRSALE